MAVMAILRLGLVRKKALIFVNTVDRVGDTGGGGAVACSSSDQSEKHCMLGAGTQDVTHAVMLKAWTGQVECGKGLLAGWTQVDVVGITGERHVSNGVSWDKTCFSWDSSPGQADLYCSLPPSPTVTCIAHTCMAPALAGLPAEAECTCTLCAPVGHEHAWVRYNQS